MSDSNQTEENSEKTENQNPQEQQPAEAEQSAENSDAAQWDYGKFTASVVDGKIDLSRLIDADDLDLDRIADLQIIIHVADESVRDL